MFKQFTVHSSIPLSVINYSKLCCCHLLILINFDFNGTASFVSFLKPSYTRIGKNTSLGPLEFTANTNL